jgi:hypothetical protein
MDTGDMSENEIVKYLFRIQSVSSIAYQVLYDPLLPSEARHAVPKVLKT